MVRRVLVVFLLGTVLLLAGGCRNKSVKNPLASVDSKQPDKVLFDRAVDAMSKRKYDVARLSLQTLINTYPDSEFVARAKLGIGDAWYAEGGSAALAQAENEYKDFITFFPNMPEAAEAQLKVADIHYKQMEKADRDYTHAKRAEDEYRQVLLQYPDSKLADQARLKLLEVQEVLAEREFRIGRFYYMRGSWAAAIARLKSVTDTYPLYSQSDDALFMLGQANEQEIDLIRKIPMNAMKEQARARLIKEYTDAAESAYSKILTRYPLQDRVGDAKARLQAMDLTVPTPTQEAIALNKKEIDSRGELGKMGKIMDNFHKHPSGVSATKVGEPTLVDPKPTDATDLIRHANDVVKEASVGGSNKVNVETVKDGKVPESQPVPRSDTGNGTTPDTSDPNAPKTQTPNDWNTVTPDSAGASSNGTTPPAATGTPTPTTNGAPAAGTATDAPKPAPEQVNEAAQPQASSSNSTSDSKATSTTKTDDKSESSSKKKKKKGLGKLNPF
jgi:outer membrane protein assembly factor BamD